MNIINNNYKLTTIDQPYRIWIIDDFLNLEVINKILDEWPSNESSNWYTTRANINKTKNILESGMLGINEPSLMPQYISKIVNYLHTQEFIDKLTNIINVEPLKTDKHMRWSGIRVMLPNSFQLIHSDARKHTETNLTKHLTCLLYLNRNYIKDRDEGCLEIWNDKMTERIHEIEPILNRLTIFENSDTSFHGVPIVKSERKAITWSVLKSLKNKGRTKALFVKRPTDPDIVEIEGLDRLNEKDLRKI